MERNNNNNNNNSNNNNNCTHTDLLLQNHTNFTNSETPSRLMFYENNSWCDFSDDAANLLRKIFSDGTAVVESEIDGVDCLVDFYRMVQIKLDGGDERSIAWIDVDGKCFFPKRFLDGNGRFNANKVDGKVNKVLQGFGCTSHEVESARWPKARVLREGEKVHDAIKSLFLEGIMAIDPGARVTGVHQVERSGPLNQARVEVFRKQMQMIVAFREGGPNMVFGWHGASEKGVEVILRYGFSEVSNVGGAEAFGVGVYLSPVRSTNLSAMLSEVDGNGEKHVILCRILLGNCEKVEAGSQQRYPSSTDFDSGVDDLTNPKWYVVWGVNMNTHIVPECIVSYRPSNPSPGNSGVFPAAKPMQNSFGRFAKLLPKLATSLPSSKVEEFQTLCCLFKEGKVAREYFLKQLRSVVGDDMLASAIRAARG